MRPASLSTQLQDTQLGLYGAPLLCNSPYPERTCTCWKNRQPRLVEAWVAGDKVVPSSLLRGSGCRLIAKYKPTMPTLLMVVPHLSTNQLRWSFTGETQVLYFNDKIRIL